MGLYSGAYLQRRGSSGHGFDRLTCRNGPVAACWIRYSPYLQSRGGAIPEGIVIIGDDSSMHVNVPEDLSVGQDMEVEDSAIDDPDP
ncbi:hypothetical protein AAY473_018825, partial [Plecturocebus cupreus]